MNLWSPRSERKDIEEVLDLTPEQLEQLRSLSLEDFVRLRSEEQEKCPHENKFNVGGVYMLRQDGSWRGSPKGYICLDCGYEESSLYGKCGSVNPKVLYYFV